MDPLNKAQAIAASILGAELDASERDALAERMGVIEVADGESIVAEGEMRRTLFLLSEGQIDVTRDGNDKVYRMRSGECAGTRAFVDGSTRKAGLRAVGATRVLTLEPEDFEALLETQPRIVYKVMRAIFRITHANLMRMNLESAELKNYVTRSQGRY